MKLLFLKYFFYVFCFHFLGFLINFYFLGFFLSVLFHCSFIHFFVLLFYFIFLFQNLFLGHCLWFFSLFSMCFFAFPFYYYYWWFIVFFVVVVHGLLYNILKNNNILHKTHIADHNKLWIVNQHHSFALNKSLLLVDVCITFF
jgi:hypothetical protein